MTVSPRIILIAAAILFAPVSRAEDPAGSCDHHVGQWLDPSSGEVLPGERLFDRLAGAKVVLLGETHTSAADHRWQAYMFAALHARNSNMTVGFEMLPRRAQAALDDWTAGRLGEDEFLERAEWEQVWGYDARYYLPLFHFARMNRLPAIALNVDRSLISRVAAEGWQAIENEQREGLSDPAPASAAYRDSLADIYAYKLSSRSEDEDGGTTAEEIRDSEAFDKFVAAQLTWDRAMAEALAAAYRRAPDGLVVGIAGRGHVEYGYGIAHQLADLGIDAVETLVPVASDRDCESLPADLASAVFVVDAAGEAQAEPRARLGVMIETAEDGVRVLEVVDDSVAEAAGIRAGDVILSAAGFDTRTTGDLIEIVQRQAPGTWLPLELSRDGEVLTPTARFPQQFE
jgi:uncharacterized iron-regulated protein